MTLARGRRVLYGGRLLRCGWVLALFAVTALGASCTTRAEDLVLPPAAERTESLDVARDAWLRVADADCPGTLPVTGYAVGARTISVPGPIDAARVAITDWSGRLYGTFDVEAQLRLGRAGGPTLVTVRSPVDLPALAPGPVPVQGASVLVSGFGPPAPPAFTDAMVRFTITGRLYGTEVTYLGLDPGTARTGEAVLVERSLVGIVTDLDADGRPLVLPTSSLPDPTVGTAPSPAC